MYRKKLGFDESYARAREASNHSARHTFIEPEALMHLIIASRNFERLKNLIEQHWEKAQQERGGSYDDRDLWLWAQALDWHS